MATALFNNPTSVSTSVGNTEDGRCNLGSCRKNKIKRKIKIVCRISEHYNSNHSITSWFVVGKKWNTSLNKKG